MKISVTIVLLLFVACGAPHTVNRNKGHHGGVNVPLMAAIDETDYKERDETIQHNIQLHDDLGKEESIASEEQSDIIQYSLKPPIIVRHERSVSLPNDKSRPNHPKPAKLKKIPVSLKTKLFSVTKPEPSKPLSNDKTQNPKLGQSKEENLPEKPSKASTESTEASSVEEEIISNEPELAGAEVQPSDDNQHKKPEPENLTQKPRQQSREKLASKPQLAKRPIARRKPEEKPVSASQLQSTEKTSQLSQSISKAKPAEKTIPKSAVKQALHPHSAVKSTLASKHVLTLAHKPTLIPVHKSKSDPTTKSVLKLNPAPRLQPILPKQALRPKPSPKPVVKPANVTANSKEVHMNMSKPCHCCHCHSTDHQGKAHHAPCPHHMASNKAHQPSSTEDQASSPSKVALIFLGIITVTLMVIVIGVSYKKISGYKSRYGGHILLKNVREECDVNSKLVDNDDVTTNDSEKNMDS